MGPMCRVLGVSRSGYYAWRQRAPSQRAQANARLVADIREVHGISRGTYGSLRVHAALKRRGVVCGHNRVARLMHCEGIVGKSPRRKHLDELLADIPELAVVIDSFEQKVQRPRDPDEQKGFYSGKKKTHTLKSQVAVDEETGRIVDVSASVPGPTPDVTLLDQSGLLSRLPEGLGALGDAGYQGCQQRW
jgi:transposase InsO family protein